MLKKLAFAPRLGQDECKKKKIPAIFWFPARTSVFPHFLPWGRGLFLSSLTPQGCSSKSLGPGANRDFQSLVGLISRESKTLKRSTSPKNYKDKINLHFTWLVFFSFAGGCFVGFCLFLFLYKLRTVERALGLKICSEVLVLPFENLSFSLMAEEGLRGPLK